MIEKIDLLKKYNFWEGQIPETGYRRVDYLKKIEKFTGNRLVKVLSGQRRTGKSYLMRQIMARLMQSGVAPRNILYINFELLAFDFIRDYKDLNETVHLYLERLQPEGKIYLFFDEIQQVDGWEKTVNSLSQDYTRDAEGFITGSNSAMLSGELATLLSGRYVHFEIFPFDFGEYCGFTDIEKNKVSYENFLKTSGLPEVLKLPDEETRRHYLFSLKDTILLRDIVARYRIKHVQLLDDIFAYVVNNASKLLSVNNLVNYFKSTGRKVNFETVQSYLDYLEAAFLIHRVARYRISGKKILANTYKYYLNDQGFKNYLYPGFAYGHGFQLENTVFLDLLRAGYTVYTGKDNGHEIDFIAMKENRKLYIQVAWDMHDEQTRMREFRSLLSVRDNYPKVVVTFDPNIPPEYEGIRIIPAWEWTDWLRENG